MNKSELTQAIAEKMNCTHKNAAEFLDALVGTISGALAKGNDVALVGFGTFCVADRAARNGRDFKTGKIVTIPAAKSIKFRPGKALKESVKP